MAKKLNTELLKLNEVCQILKVHPNTLRKWDRKGILRAIRFGQRGDRRYKQADIMNLLNTNNGNHDYEFVKKDIELYYPKLKKGGVLGGDNFDSIASYEWWVIKK